MTTTQTTTKNISKASITILTISCIVAFTSIFIVNLLNQQMAALSIKTECLTNAIQVESKKTTLTILATNAINIYDQLENGDDKTDLSNKITEASNLLDYSTTDAVTSTNFDYSKYKEEYSNKADEMQTTIDDLTNKCNNLIDKYNLAQSE